jgi:hypothetical protein
MLSSPVPPCSKCGSTRIVPDARVTQRSVGAIEGPYSVELVVDRHSHAALQPGSVRSEVRARICADCGFVEFFAVDAYALFSAFEASRQ